jgi:alpha-D-ribose 1-methylphosphonate 5-triphosphate synthase subunit PhnH
VGIATAPGSPSILESETRLVGAGVAALHAGDAARALTLLDQHAREYPHGILAEERAAERVAALCALGRAAEARQAAAAFLRDHVRSPLSPHVRGLCGVLSNP